MPYIERNKIDEFQIGEKVLVTRRIREDERERWGIAWVDEMNERVGKVLTVTHLGDGGVILDNDFIFPCFVLAPAVFDFIGEEG